jgi:hypothetical protein
MDWRDLAEVEMRAVTLGPSVVDPSVVARPVPGRWYDMTHHGVKAGSPGADHKRETAGDPANGGQLRHRKVQLATVASPATGVSPTGATSEVVQGHSVRRILKVCCELFLCVQ